MRPHYLTADQVELYLRDLREGPAGRFCHLGRARLVAPVHELRLRRRFDALVAAFPRLGWRVRRDSIGWHFEPAPRRPDLYVEHHQVDGDGEAARRRLRVECHRPVDPVTGPLGRATLLRYGDGSADLVLTVHELAVPTCPPPRLLRRIIGDR
jgi:hypothetical protein